MKRWMAWLVLALALALTGAEVSKIRPLHYVSTDKPVYRPGETVYVRDVILDGLTNYPVDLSENRGMGASMRVRILGPRGEEVASGMLVPRGAANGFAWTIPPHLAGGDYRVRLEGAKNWAVSGTAAPAERRFEVRAYRVPRIKTQIEFARRGYLPGERCEAVVRFERAEGGIPAAAVVTASALVDGRQVLAETEVKASGGEARVAFALPKEIATGDGTLAFVIRDGGVVEAAAKSIPILVENYDVAFYPEGGDLVAGVPNRVYVSAVRRDGKGADLKGTVFAGEEKVADYASVHDGRGIVEFTPTAGKSYVLKVRNEAAGRVQEFALPAPKAGLALAATAPSYAYGTPVTVKVQGAGAIPEGTAVVLRKRDQELSKAKVSGASPQTVALSAGEAEGVLTATLYDAQGNAVAERLLFRAPRFRVHLEFEGVKEPVSPGAPVKVAVVAKDDAGNPVAAQVGLAVTDASVQEMIDRREQAPRLPEMVYLENEVLEFADAADYFNPRDPQAAVKLDLLLGTQGWRRFITVRIEDIRKAHPDALLRAIAPELTVRPQPRVVYKSARARNNVDFAAAGAGAPMEDGMVFEAKAAAAPRPMPMAANAAKAMPEAAAADADAGVQGVVQKEAKPVKMKADVMADVQVPGRPVAAAKQRRPGFPAIRMQVREYAHQVRLGRKPGDRVDFAETLYWNATATTDPRTGRYEFTFGMPDTVGTFRVVADAFGNNGALGAAVAELQSLVPFYAELKLPPFLSVGDEMEVPLTLVNTGKSALAGANVVVTAGAGLELSGQPAVGAALAPGERRRLLVKVRAVKASEAAELTVAAVAGGQMDRVTRKTKIVSRLFPFGFSAGARVSASKPLAAEVEIPAEVENGSQKATVQVYTSPAATMEAALAALLRQPHGCFEQTSSTNYPLVMAQQYFLSHSGIAPERVKQARELLEQGYQKLVSFECKEKGYEWFGADPGHEALTAYGLMEFSDMSQVMQVDAAMLERTRAWLMSRRAGDGTFRQNSKALDSFGRAPAPTTNLYILWALLESGQKPDGLQAEIEHAKKVAGESKEAYLKGLGANILFLAGDRAGATALAEALAKWQQEDGMMGEPGGTITCSGGVSRQLENTALAALAWTRLGEAFVAPLERAMRALASKCEAGKFGSTQATVLVLKAINAYDKAFAKPLKAGQVQLFVDGAPFGAPVAFTEKSTGVLDLPDCGLALGPGRHRLEVRMTDGSEMTASMQVKGMTLKPSNAGAILPGVRLQPSQLREGEPAEIKVTMRNMTQQAAGMTVACVAIPAGLEVRVPQLQELVKAGRIAAYELFDNRVVLYWRGMAARSILVVPVSCVAAIPGNYTGAATSAYLYYTDEEKQYLPGLSVTITPR